MSIQPTTTIEIYEASIGLERWELKSAKTLLNDQQNNQITTTVLPGKVSNHTQSNSILDNNIENSSDQYKLVELSTILWI